MWTKEPTNPRIGQGVNGIAGSCGRPFVILDGSTYVMYFNLNSGNVFKRSTSTDGITWTAPTDVFTIPFGTIAGNCSIVINGGVWHMIYEALQTVWKMGYATSPDGITWTNQAGPLTSLSVGGAYGGPHLVKTAPGWEMWYHASQSGNLPTNIYYAISTDLITWTNVALIIGRSLAWEVDQVADPFVRTEASVVTMYYAGVDNVAKISKISKATYA